MVGAREMAHKQEQHGFGIAQMTTQQSQRAF